MPGWNDFFVAEIGASAALAGLIFVGISINLTKILSIGGLPWRALEALLLLLAVLINSSLLLIPDQTTFWLGIELLILGIFIWFGMLTRQMTNLRRVEKRWRGQFVQSILFTQISTFPYIIAGVAVLVQGASGLYWIVPAIFFSFITAFIDAWVLLVEINR